MRPCQPARPPAGTVVCRTQHDPGETGVKAEAHSSWSAGSGHHSGRRSGQTRGNDPAATDLRQGRACVAASTSSEAAAAGRRAGRPARPGAGRAAPWPAGCPGRRCPGRCRRGGRPRRRGRPHWPDGRVLPARCPAAMSMRCSRSCPDVVCAFPTALGDGLREIMGVASRALRRSAAAILRQPWARRRAMLLAARGHHPCHADGESIGRS